MNYYKNTSPDWGANTPATLEDYQTATTFTLAALPRATRTPSPVFT
jgi:hypothetical protein